MSVFTPVRHLTRVAAIAALGGALALGTAACGAGQISQTANQQAAVNGSAATVGTIALRDVHFVFPSSGSSAEFVNGGPLQMAFLISNNSPDTDDSLQSIAFASGSGSVAIDGSKALPATKSLRAGQPSQLLVPTSVDSSSSTSPSAASNNSADPSETRITVTATGAGKQITPGLTVPMVFTFAKAGKVTVSVPVDAGSELARDTGAVQNPEAGAEGGEG